MRKIIMIVVMLSASMAYAADTTTVTPKEPYTSASGQDAYKNLLVARLKQENLSLKAQKEYAELQQQAEAENKKLADWVANVRKENGWDETYLYDAENDKWLKQKSGETKPALPQKK